MKILGAKLYDPAVAVTKATTAVQAMTAIDTTNLRLTVTVPSHGMLRVRLAGVVHGAVTFPSILVGVMEGATVRGRVAPSQRLGNTAVATALVHWEAEFTITGLTPGSITLDAAYGVETLVASTGIKYGGANNTVANDAFGGLVYEIFDPDPWSVYVAPVDVSSNVAAIKAKTDNLPASPAAASDCLSAAGVRGAIGLAAPNLDTQFASLPSANAVRDAVFSKAFGSYTFAQVTDMMAIKACGKRTASGSNRIWWSLDNTRAVITHSFTEAGEITSSTLNPA